MQVQVTLTPAESKRLIAKAIATLPEVKKALKTGIIFIGLGTTNAHVVEELSGKPIDRGRYVAGLVLPVGTCVLPREKRLKNFVIMKGKPCSLPIDEVLEKMGPKDVVIKGANAIDAHGTAGIFLASRRGGTIGKVLGYVRAKGINLIMPVGLEKFIPGSLKEISNEAGIFKSNDATGCAVGLAAVDGKIITEINAGVSGAEGSVTLLISGTTSQVKRMMKTIRKIKGIKDPEIITSCKDCKHQDCFYSSHSS